MNRSKRKANNVPMELRVLGVPNISRMQAGVRFAKHAAKMMFAAQNAVTEPELGVALGEARMDLNCALYEIRVLEETMEGMKRAAKCKGA